MKDFTARQQQIMDVSLQLIAEKGIQELTIRNLSERIGISAPAIYRHFSSKTDILLGLLTRLEQDIIRSSEAAISPNMSALEGIEVLFVRHLERFAANPSLSAVVFAEEIFQNDRRLADKVLHIMNTHRALVLGMIQQGQESKELREDVPKEDMGLMVMASLRLLLTRWRLLRFDFDLEEKGRVLWGSLRKLIQKQ